MRDVQATDEATVLKRDHQALQNMKSSFFIFLKVIFALLDPDLDTSLVKTGV
jgi:hypothetical protein